MGRVPQAGVRDDGEGSSNPLPRHSGARPSEKLFSTFFNNFLGCKAVRILGLQPDRFDMVVVVVVDYAHDE